MSHRVKFYAIIKIIDFFFVDRKVFNFKKSKKLNLNNLENPYQQENNKIFASQLSKRGKIHQYN